MKRNVSEAVSISNSLRAHRGLRWALCSLVLFLPCSPVLADRVSVALPEAVESINPFARPSLAEEAVLSSLSSRLLYRNAKGEIALGIARSVETRDDARTWCLDIPNGLRFASGRSLTAEELKRSVLYYVDRLRSDPGKRELAAAFDELKGIRIEQSTLRDATSHSPLGRMCLMLRNPSQEFASTLSAIPIIDTVLWREFDRFAGRSTMVPILGPYVVKENLPGGALTLVENTGSTFHGAVQNEELQYIPFVSDEAALRALRSGAIDVIPLVTPRLLEKAESDTSLKVIESPLCRRSPCRITKEHWGEIPLAENRIISDKILVRSSFEFDSRFTDRFDLSGLYWSSASSLAR